VLLAQVWKDFKNIVSALREGNRALALLLLPLCISPLFFAAIYCGGLYGTAKIIKEMDEDQEPLQEPLVVGRPVPEPSRG